MCLTHRRGFTYVELVVVVAIIAVVSALIVPRMASIRQGQDERAFRAGLRDLASQARSRAIETGDIVTLAYDKSTSKVHVS